MKVSRRKPEAAMPVMAMGDITFNLLIFFVIMANSQVDQFLVWEPAAAEQLESVSATTVGVVIDQEGELYLNGQPTTPGALEDQVRELLGDRPAGDRTVTLKVHKTTPAPVFEPVIESIAKAGGDLVHVLKRPDQS